MTTNKSLGQTFKIVGVDLPRLVFSHDQLYVVVSRVTTWEGLKILVHDGNTNNLQQTTHNVVYKEVFQNLPKGNTARA